MNRQERRVSGAATTRLSRRSLASGGGAALSRRARLSLPSIASVLLVSSCIVADPPEYRDPVQTRPVLDVYQANPTTSRVLVVHTNDPVKVNVPVRSEDAGVDLSAHFFIDYGIGSTNVSQITQTIPASTYADTGRAVALTWKVPALSVGCHLLSLIVAHRTSFENENNDILDPQKADIDASIINWWLNANPASADDVSTLVNCPTVGVTPTTTTP